MPEHVLRQLTPRVWWLNPVSQTDRPTLGVVAGDRASLVVDTGNSPDHARALRGALARAGLPAPRLVVLTHWHWDHVFGAATLDVPALASTETQRVVSVIAGLDWSDAALDRRVAAGVEIAFCRDMIRAELPDRASLLIRPPEIAFDYGECGMPLSTLLPHIGSCADDIGMIHSCHHKVFAHAQAELEALTGRDVTGRPSAGAWLIYGLGSESANLPAYAVLMTGRGPTTRSLAWGSGFLPSEYQGVPLRNEGEPILDLKNPAGVSADVRRKQLDALARLNGLRREVVRDPEIDAKTAAYELAFRMQTAAPELVELTSESEQTLDDYGATRDGDPGDFGRNCLLARRLVERGVRFVSIFHRKWDQHSNLAEEYPKLCHEIDQPIGALIKDLKQRGMLDSTLVVCATEFGRTAMSQNDTPGPGAGRDHHPFAFTQWMAGGGVRGGHAVGRTDEMSWNVVEDPVHINDFHATLLHIFGLDHLQLTYRFRGLDVRLTDQAGQVVKKILA